MAQWVGRRRRCAERQAVHSLAACRPARSSPASSPSTSFITSSWATPAWWSSTPSSPPVTATASRCPISWAPSCGGGARTRAPAAAPPGPPSSGCWSGWARRRRAPCRTSTWRRTT
jgi:hypothetical protein